MMRQSKTTRQRLRLTLLYSKALFHLAFLLDIRGDEQAAIDYYKQLINNGTAYVSALLNLAVLYEDGGRI